MLYIKTKTDFISLPFFIKPRHSHPKHRFTFQIGVEVFTAHQFFKSCYCND